MKTFMVLDPDFKIIQLLQLKTQKQQQKTLRCDLCDGGNDNTD